MSQWINGRSGAPRRWLAYLLGSLLLVGVLWVIDARLLAVDRGLNLHDESLYLLSLDPPERYASWGLPSAWTFIPLFSALSYDIANMRVVGVLALQLSTAFLAGQVASAANESRRTPLLGRQWSITRAVVMVFAALASMLFYSWMVRTPGYDLFNLIGLTIALGGVVAWLRSNDAGRRRGPASRYLPLAVASVGGFITLPAKPTSWPFLLLSIVLLGLIWCGWRRAVAGGLAFVGLTITAVFLAIATGLWSTTIFESARQSLSQPSFHPYQTVSVALQRELTVPIKWWSSFWAIDRPLKYVALAGFLMLLVACFMRLSPKLQVAVYSIVLLALVLSVRADGYLDLLQQASTAGIAILIVTATFAISSRRSGDPSAGGDASGVARTFAISAVLLAAALAYGFGSLNDPLTIASRCWGLMLVAAAAMVIVSVSRPLLGLVALGMAMTYVTLWGLVTGWRQPLDMLGSIAEQTDSISIGSHQTSLKVRPDVAESLERLRSATREAGLVEGTPLLGAVWQWTTGVTYWLGAEAPPSLMLSILYGSPNSLAIQKYHAELLPCEPWGAAWLMTSDPNQTPPEGFAQVQDAAVVTAAAFGRRFPEDFNLVVRTDGLQFWKPRNSVVPDTAPCRSNTTRS